MATISKLAVMSNYQSAVFKLLIGFGIVLTAAFGVWWFMPSHIPNNFAGWQHVFDYIMFLIVTYVVWHQITSEVFNWMVAKDMKHPRMTSPQPGLRVAFLTAFVPGKEPYDILESTLSAMCREHNQH